MSEAPATNVTNFPSQEAVITPPKPLTIYEEVAQRSPKLTVLLRGTGISTERLIHAFQMELYRNPKLQNCQKNSLLQALMRCAELGLEPGSGSVYLIPYNGVAQVQVGVQGWLTLLWRSGKVENITYNLHREGDEFWYCVEETGTAFHHKPKLEGEGEILGAYALVTLANGHIQLKYCNRREIESSKKASKSTSEESPWLKHFDQMAQIVPLRKLARILAPSLHEGRPEDLGHPSSLPEALETSHPSTVGSGANPF
jgi:recombination protein RecT